MRRSTRICYLGISIHQSFRWDERVKIMAARACSTIRPLHTLGNSARGPSILNWRKVYHAAVLPTLTYSAPIWSHHLPKSAMQCLQVARNDAIRGMSGAFRTTPTDPLHAMLAAPPTKYTFVKLRHSFQRRLSALSPSALLHTLPTNDPSTYHSHAISMPSPLTALLPPPPLPFFLPSNVTRPYPCLTSLTSSLNHTNWLHHIAYQAPHSILTYHLPHPDHFIPGWLLYRGQDFVAKVYRHSTFSSHDNDIATGLLMTSKHHQLQFPSLCRLTVSLSPPAPSSGKRSKVLDMV